MPKRSPAYMADQRNFILDTALDCLIDKGLHATSLADICQRSGLSVGAVYVHFRNKDEILTGVAERNLLRSKGQPEIDSWEEFEEWFLGGLAFYAENGGVARARLAAQLLAESHENPVLSDMQERYLEAQDKLIRRALSILSRKGEIALPLGLGRTVALLPPLVLGLYLNSIREPGISWEERGELLRVALRTLVKG